MGAGTPTTAVQAFDDTLANLRNLATAEETYFTDHDAYTSTGSKLADEGFTRTPGTDAEILYAGVDPKKGYCLLGSPAAHGAWYIYDSQNGGFVHKGFTTRQVAASYCSDSKIKHYAPIQ